MNEPPTQDASEAPFSEATAALWRHRFRAPQAFAPFPQDDVRTDRSPAASGPAVISPPYVPAHDPATLPLTPEQLPVTPAPQRKVPRSDRGGRRFAHVPGLLLIAILTLQAVLSLRLVWSNTASLNEAIYLFGGHVELAHWLHGTPLPPLATYLPGAPVIYPPLAALAASAGGLAAARMLSLAFVLGATGLLWSTTSKLFGQPAAFFAAALFAVSGPTQALGALATYDAMALCLLAASAWCVVSAQDRDNSTWFLVAGTSLLVLANATVYATVVLDPAVIALAAITVARSRGLKPGFVRSGHLAASTLGLAGALLALGGPLYLSGVLSTTFSGSGSKPAFLVLADASKWCGLVCALAALGIICALRRADRGHLVIVIVLAVSGTLVPLDQALLHTTASLFKEADLGAWFAAAAAGFAIARMFGAGRRMWLRAGAASLAGTLAVAVAGATGCAQASRYFQAWPNSAATIAALRSLTRAHPGNYLAEDFDVPAYYLEGTIAWPRWSQTWYFAYQSPRTHRLLSGDAAYQAAIDDGYFALIVLSLADTADTDAQIVADMSQAGTYQEIREISVQDDSGSGQVMVWAYQPRPAGHQGSHGHG
jgi:hypothetical protein